MTKKLISPAKYIQGPGELKKLGEHVGAMGKKALILISQGGYKRIGKIVEDSFKELVAKYSLIILMESVQRMKSTV